MYDPLSADTMQLDLPSLCARCGTAGPMLVRWTVERSSGTLSPWTLATVVVGFVVHGRRDVRVTVGVCPRCRLTLLEAEAACRIWPSLGCLVGFMPVLLGLGVGFGVRGVAWIPVVAAATIVGMVGVYLGEHAVPHFIHRSRGCLLVRIGRKGLRFVNRTYQMEYERLQLADEPAFKGTMTVSSSTTVSRVC